MKIPLIAILCASVAVPVEARQARSPEPSLGAGDMVPTFDARGVDGLVKHVAFPKGSKTVLLFFTSGCSVCHRMLPVWSEWFLRKPKDLVVIGVLLDREPPGFFSLMPVTFPVVRPPDAGFSRMLKIHRVPMTVRIGPGGRVEDAAQGVLDPIRLGQLFRP